MAEARVLGRSRDAWQNIKDFLAAHTVSSAGGVLFLLLAIFLLWPLSLALVKSIYGPEGLTLEYYKDFLANRYFYQSFLNTLLLGLMTTSVCVGAGFCIAYMTTRGPMRLRSPLKLIALSPLVAPPFIFGISLITLLGRNGIITNALNLDWNIYGFKGPVIAQTLAYLPVAYMMIENTLSSLNPNLEDSAANLGAREGKILRSITVPLLIPGFWKAALVVYALAVAEFGNVALLCGRVPFLAPDTYLMIIGERDYNMAGVLSFFLILPCVVIFIAQSYLIKGKGYATILGKPVAAEPRRITPSILIPMLTVSFIACGAILLTYGIVAVGAFTNIVGVDNTFTLSHILDSKGTFALFNSLRMALFGAIIGATIGLLLAYVIVRGKFRGRGVLEVLGLIGFTLPGTVFGIGYILAFNKPPLLLTGTIAIVALVSAFRRLAVSEQAGITKLQQLSIEVEEASLNLGASTATTFRRIVLPIIFPAFVYGFIFVFMRAMISLSAVIFLVTPGCSLAAVSIFNAANWGRVGLASALTLKLIVVVAASLAILQALSKWTGLSVTRKGV